MYYPEEAIELWEGNRGMEEYAREAFQEEERANGMTWMDDFDDDFEDGDGTPFESKSGTPASASGHGPDLKDFTGSC